MEAPHRYYRVLQDEKGAGRASSSAPTIGNSSLTLDELLTYTYRYYLGKGFKNIALAMFLKLLQAAWVVFLTTFLLTCVDWRTLYRTYDSSQAVGFQGLHPLVAMCLVVISAVWLWQLWQCVREVQLFLDIRRFYQTHLLLSDEELQTAEWNRIVRQLLSELSRMQVEDCPQSALEVTNRIMRKENYFIAMVNQDVLQLSVPFLSQRKFMTKILELCIWNIVFSYVYDKHSPHKISLAVKGSDASPAQRRQVAQGLQRLFLIAGVLSLMLAPFVLVFLFIYSFFEYGEQLRSQPSVFTGRRWSILATWRFRELNELPHVFRRRLAASVAPAQSFVDCFPFTYAATLARFATFVLGSIVVVLVVVGLLDDNAMFRIQIYGLNLLWLTGVGSALVAACRSMVPNEFLSTEPVKALEQVVQHTHYFPESWRGHAHTYAVHSEFAELFEYRLMGFVLEVSSDAIVDFFRRYTVHHARMGDICTFGQFPLEKLSASDYGLSVGAPSDSSPAQHLRHGKLEKSFLNFAAHHPEIRRELQDGARYMNQMWTHARTSQARSAQAPPELDQLFHSAESGVPEDPDPSLSDSAIQQVNRYFYQTQVNQPASTNQDLYAYSSSFP